MIKEVNGPTWSVHPTSRKEVGFFDDANHYSLLSEGMDSNGVFHVLWHPTVNDQPFVVDKVTRSSGKWTYARELESDNLPELILRYISNLNKGN